MSGARGPRKLIRLPAAACVVQPVLNAVVIKPLPLGTSSNTERAIQRQRGDSRCLQFAGDKGASNSGAAQVGGDSDGCTTRPATRLPGLRGAPGAITIGTLATEVWRDRCLHLLAVHAKILFPISWLLLYLMGPMSMGERARRHDSGGHVMKSRVSNAICRVRTRRARGFWNSMVNVAARPVFAVPCP